MLQLLVAAAAKAMLDTGSEDDAELLRELVVNNPRKAKGVDTHKVWPTNANREAFVAVMTEDGPPSGHFDDPGNLIDEVFDYFAGRVIDYLKGTDEEHPENEGFAERSERLRITLCHLLKVVSITLERDDNAQVIFETLNARGTPLLSLDLVKNAVFRLRDLAAESPLSELRSSLQDSQVDDAVSRLLARRNDRSHLRDVDAIEFEQGVEAAAFEDLEILLRTLEVLSDLHLVVLTAVHWDEFAGTAKVFYRALTGDHPVVPTQSVDYVTSALEIDSLYLLDSDGKLHLLRPYLLGMICPTCRTWSTFHLDRCPGGVISVKSLEHGHTSEQRQLASALQQVGLLRAST